MSMFSIVYIQEHMSRDLYPLIFQGLRIIFIVPAHQKIFLHIYSFFITKQYLMIRAAVFENILLPLGYDPR